MKQAILVALLAAAMPAIGSELPPEKNTCTAALKHRESCNIIEHTPLEKQVQNSFWLLWRNLTPEQTALLDKEQSAWRDYVAKKQAWTAGESSEQIRAKLQSERSAELRSAAESRSSSPQDWLKSRSVGLVKSIGDGYHTHCVGVDMGAYQSYNCDWNSRHKLQY